MAAYAAIDVLSVYWNRDPGGIDKVYSTFPSDIL